MVLCLLPGADHLLLQAGAINFLSPITGTVDPETIKKPLKRALREG
jgi:hypothetical protein